MGNGFEKTYEPQPELVETYAGIYKKYELLGEFVENNINNKG